MIKKRLLKYYRLLQYVTKLSKIRRAKPDKRTIAKIGILVSISPDSEKFAKWHDGFTKALDLLEKDYTITYIYFHLTTGNLISQINECDFLIVKSSWRTPMDYFLRKNHKIIKPYLGLMISASNKGPSKREQAFYDVAWYETNWYRKNKLNHPNSFHAFGIDTLIMKKLNQEKKYDIIAVGAPRSYKLLDKLLDKEGKKLLIGDMKNTDSRSSKLIKALSLDHVIIEDFKDYATLAEKYNQSQVCYVPCKLHGGGERAVLEARACGIDVLIESDNPKLNELLDSPIWDSSYYAAQLKKGIQSIAK